MNNRLLTKEESTVDRQQANDGNKSMTLDDIAKALGVSKTTVSRVISGKGRISEDTRHRVQQYIKEHNYRPNLIAKSLAESKTCNIGVVLPGDSDLIEIPCFQSCLMGVCDVAASLDYDLVVTTTIETDIKLLKRLVCNNKVDGIILTRPLTDDLAIAYLKQCNIPFVIIGQSEASGVIKIDNNHLARCHELTQVLLQTGAQKLALIIGSLHHIVNANRYSGYIKAHNDLNQGVNEDLIFLDTTSKVLIDRAVDEIVKSGVDCIVCSDDMICSRVLSKLEEDGYVVPKDIKVASFYNSAYLENHHPPITSIRINIKELGIAAGRCLIDLIRGQEVNEKTLLDYEVVLKKSTIYF